MMDLLPVYILWTQTYEIWKRNIIMTNLKESEKPNLETSTT